MVGVYNLPHNSYGILNKRAMSFEGGRCWWEFNPCSQWLATAANLNGGTLHWTTDMLSFN